MLCKWFSCTTFVSLFGLVFGLTTGLAPGTKNTYICLTDDTPCPTVRFGAQDSIIPRIVTSNNLCPIGYFPCYGIETPCGEKLVGAVKEADGDSDNGAHPWQAYLSNSEGEFLGSGVLLDPFHILTAAHKIDEKSPDEVIVFMGVWDPKDLTNTQSSKVQNISIYPTYNKETLLNDIAILRLENPIVLGVQNNINTICMPNSTANFTGLTCTVSGWGQTSFTTLDAPTSPQKQVTLPVVSPLACYQSFARSNLLGYYVDKYLDQEGEICAGGENQKDACTQDGGSPLECIDVISKQLTVAGLVIWGKNCGQPGVYGVYVNIPYYVPWITAKINSLNTIYAIK